MHVSFFFGKTDTLAKGGYWEGMLGGLSRGSGMLAEARTLSWDTVELTYYSTQPGWTAYGQILWTQVARFHLMREIIMVLWETCLLEPIWKSNIIGNSSGPANRSSVLYCHLYDLALAKLYLESLSEGIIDLEAQEIQSIMAGPFHQPLCPWDWPRLQ